MWRYIAIGILAFAAVVANAATLMATGSSSSSSCSSGSVLLSQRHHRPARAADALHHYRRRRNDKNHNTKIRGGSATRKTRTKSSSNASVTITAGLKDSLASALAAACSKMILAPFDTIKTVQQQYVGSNNAPLQFLPACRLILNRGGLQSFYAGLGVSVLGSMPSVGLYFGVYSYCKRTIHPFLEKRFAHGVGSNDNDCTDSSSSRLLWTVSIATSAAIGNTIASVSRVPYEVVKQKLQTGEFSSTRQAIVQMAKSGGAAGGASAWRAFFPMGSVSIQMMRDIPYAVVTLLTYEYLQQHFVKPHQAKVLAMAAAKTSNKARTTGTTAATAKNTAWCDMVAGALAGGWGSFVTNPLDVLKTRLQTDSLNQYDNGSIVACARDTYAKGGASAFFRGSLPRLLHKVPANGFFFLFYEFFRKVLHVESGGNSIGNDSSGGNGNDNTAATSTRSK